MRVWVNPTVLEMGSVHKQYSFHVDHCDQCGAYLLNTFVMIELGYIAIMHYSLKVGNKTLCCKFKLYKLLKKVVISFFIVIIQT